MTRKLVSMLVIALFLSSFAGTAFSEFSEEAEETMTLKGRIVSISDETGEVGIVDESGKMTTLRAGSGTDLKTLSSGDQVTIEYSSDGVITSITGQY